MRHGQHHKKMDSKIPAWLYFALHDMTGRPKTLNPIEIGLNVLKALTDHYEERKKLGQGIILKPNNYDSMGLYGKCLCDDCNFLWIDEADRLRQIAKRTGNKVKLNHNARA